MQDLWELLLSAQDSVTGIPAQFLEQKKEEIKKRMVSVLLDSSCFLTWKPRSMTRFIKFRNHPGISLITKRKISPNFVEIVKI